MAVLQDWRKATGTFHILDQAQPHFETFKVHFSLYITATCKMQDRNICASGLSAALRDEIFSHRDSLIMEWWA